MYFFKYPVFYKKITKRMHNFIEKQHLLVTFLALGYYGEINRYVGV